jgi:hypothetical protein
MTHLLRLRHFLHSYIFCLFRRAHD